MPRAGIPLQATSCRLNSPLFVSARVSITSHATPMDTDEEFIPSSPQQPFTCLIAFITSQTIPRAAAALPALPLSFPL